MSSLKEVISIKKNIELKMLRTSKDYTQKQMADKIGFCVSYFSMVEQGKRAGSKKFWNRLQKEFDLDGGTIWRMLNNYEKEEHQTKPIHE